MKDDNCIFCKLANGDIPTNKIYEDDLFTVILDADPVSRGHALILPKNHYANIYELGDKEAAAIFPLAKKIASHMKEVLHCDGFNVLQNNGETAGQSVFHFHMHLIPRYNDAPNNSTLLGFSHAGLSDDEIKEICDKLRMN
ncbi:MAG: HIT family protein [Lachnospiraceae bacterium]|uniref:HIT family protein n=1 Tax=Candidatus Weimeria bifida TaxID=2599074 RepID=A0A6N7J384_9FIRM|nr:HIT family protein [Candidatus Weimeria bifida]RRF96838.1 MAG: HIT family protein [Lachnospiraceae bacterium]